MQTDTTMMAGDTETKPVCAELVKVKEAVSGLEERLDSLLSEVTRSCTLLAAVKWRGSWTQKEDVVETKKRVSSLAYRCSVVDEALERQLYAADAILGDDSVRAARKALVKRILAKQLFARALRRRGEAIKKMMFDCSCFAEAKLSTTTTTETCSTPSTSTAPTPMFTRAEEICGGDSPSGSNPQTPQPMAMTDDSTLSCSDHEAGDDGKEIESESESESDSNSDEESESEDTREKAMKDEKENEKEQEQEQENNTTATPEEPEEEREENQFAARYANLPRFHPQFREQALGATHITLEADLRGVREGDIDFQLLPSTDGKAHRKLVVRGVRRQPTGLPPWFGGRRRSAHTHDPVTSWFEESFNVPLQVLDVEKATFDFSRGVLVIKLPRRTGLQAERRAAARFTAAREAALQKQREEEHHREQMRRQRDRRHRSTSQLFSSFGNPFGFW